ncbi:alpha/beta hydrolase [Actinoplanes bogorensis]|uniref:Alpha/beta hydrolase n=1 Tax=Paractinoplanes bogorensis TaxID=1610840 RepID=A0ABS5YJQ3_9ACTN|nr:alpha/beta hydrolase [Actinoplanes bogorensis]MBU2663647.1 alpha/beta hydrolase [Actinoplanes bogorensis]
MVHTQIDGFGIAYTDSAGDGEPLLLIHGGGLADWCTILAATPALQRFRVIRMVRAGYLGTAADGLSVADHARHAATLLRRLDATGAHVVAHSSGSAIALQLAVDDPAVVRTLTLLEPPLVDPLADPADLDALHAAFGPVMGAAMGALARGDEEAAFDTFMSLVCGPGYRDVLNSVLGTEVVDAAARSSRHFFSGEVQALNGWTFDPAAVTQPLLLVQGAESLPLEHRLIAHLARLVPGSTIATVEHVNHLMPLTAPAVLARLVTEFTAARTPSTTPAA